MTVRTLSFAPGAIQKVQIRLLPINGKFLVFAVIPLEECDKVKQTLLAEVPANGRVHSQSPPGKSTRMK